MYLHKNILKFYCYSTGKGEGGFNITKHISTKTLNCAVAKIGIQVYLTAFMLQL